MMSKKWRFRRFRRSSKQGWEENLNCLKDFNLKHLIRRPPKNRWPVNCSCNTFYTSCRFRRDRDRFAPSLYVPQEALQLLARQGFLHTGYWSQKWVPLPEYRSGCKRQVLWIRFLIFGWQPLRIASTEAGYWTSQWLRPFLPDHESRSRPLQQKSRYARNINSGTLLNSSNTSGFSLPSAIMISFSGPGCWYLKNRHLP